MKFVWIFLGSLSELFKDIAENSRNDPSFFPIITPAHSKSLSWSSLSISKDGSIVSIQAIINNWFSNILKDLILISIFLKDSIEGSLMNFFGIG